MSLYTSMERMTRREGKKSIYVYLVSLVYKNTLELIEYIILL